MDPMTLGLLIGAGTGVVKSELIDRPKEKRDRKLAAETQRLSPWTGLQAQAIKEADPLASALQFGGAGAQMGMGIQNQGLNQKMYGALLAQQAAPAASPYPSMAPGPVAQSPIISPNQMQAPQFPAYNQMMQQGLYGYR